MSDLFVSYASADRERVATLVQRLEQLGFSVWWDRDIADGQNFHRVIEQALDQAKCAIVVWSQHSVNSEWVINEASSAHKRNALVPALIDGVEPPLAFRHLQTADLRDDNPNAEREYEKLKRSLQQIVGGPARMPANAGRDAKPKSLWQTPLGWAMGAGVFLLGAAALLAVLKQLGWIGETQMIVGQRAPESAQATSSTSAQSPLVPEGAPQTQLIAKSTAPESVKPIPPAQERINLLERENGAEIVAAGEEAWRTILETQQPKCALLSKQSFVIVGLGKDQPTPIATLAVHVDAQGNYNLKQLALFAADDERGPFKKIGEFEIPNHKNMRAPFHEFKFEPVTTRYVKLQIVSFVHGDGPNGNICTMQLYGPRQLKRAGS